ncbi:MAG: mannitol dehydrogenase family protein [Immundisolibacterales bacterium]|nr:mannitol dehydrogenase family protein [Immundisolibacterales bacterium]
MHPVGEAALLRTTYDRDATRVGVVHVGVGAFHRAHQAVFFDDLMERTGDLDWAIAGVNLRPAQSGDIARLQGGGGAYVVKSYGPDGGSEFRQVRAHKALLDWSRQAARAEDVVADAGVQALSLTVTESGYCLADDGGLDLGNHEIRAELEGTGKSSVYAYLQAALGKRRAAGGRPLTVLCCDNLRDNGTMLERNLGAYLSAAGDPGLASWIADHVSFPCSMVDRITPRPEPRHAREVAERFGIADDFTVHCERFMQWVIGDEFRGARPELEAAGAELVAEVRPYEEAKIRILNGGHLALAYLAALRGFETYDAALRDPALSAFFDELTASEILPSLDSQTPVDLPAYRESVKRRFLNRSIADRISRIAMDGASKFPVFLLPTIRECYARGIVPRSALTSVASWYVFLRHLETGRLEFDYVDPKLPMIRPLLGAGREEEFARLTALWGDMAIRHPEFVHEVCARIAELEREYPGA